MRTLTVGKVRIAWAIMLIAAASCVLSACSDDALKGRRDACAQFEKSGVLAESDMAKCLSEKAVFSASAEKVAVGIVADVYPTLTESARRMAAYVESIDRTTFGKLPTNVTNPIALIEDDKKSMNWRVVVELEHVNFDAPELRDGVVHREWQISGTRRGGKDDLWYLDVVGVGTIQFRDLEDVCILLAYSSTEPGCQAQVYVDAVTEYGMTELVAMAIEFLPPTKQQALKIILEQKMDDWAPKATR